ncbi:MAG: hypothetical protein J3K34DRAFT_403533 [Monoraphidium minutum]|nr:MAG: hypothetical protein J3K34DRAFT_403533 [Monoraphidium minutum]
MAGTAGRNALLCAAGALALLSLGAHAQTEVVDSMVLDDTFPVGPNSSFGTMNIASVISNIWVGAFALTSIVFAIFGLAVAFQWPNPRCFCYRTPYSDLPAAAAGRACCSLYTLNVGFCVAWILLLAIMAVSRDVTRIAVCVAFVVVHALAVGAFRLQFKRKGRPAYPEAEMVRRAAERLPNACRVSSLEGFAPMNARRGLSAPSPRFSPAY